MLPNKAVSFGNSPTSTILALRPESKERLNSRRRVRFNRSSWSQGTRWANRSTVSTSAYMWSTDDPLNPSAIRAEKKRRVLKWEPILHKTKDWPVFCKYHILMLTYDIINNHGYSLWTSLSTLFFCCTFYFSCIHKVQSHHQIQHLKLFFSIV